MKKTIYKSVIQIEVLTEEPIDKNTSLIYIFHEAEFGSYSMIRINKELNKPLKGIGAAREIRNQGTNIGFFGMDENGNKLKD
jgi:hypothetical protein